MKLIIKFLLILIIIELGLLIGLGFFTLNSYQIRQATKEEELAKQALMEEIKEIDFKASETAVMQWQEYINYSHSFSLRHPQEVIIEERADGSVSVTKYSSDWSAGLNLFFDSFLLGERSLKEIAQQSLPENTSYQEISLGGVSGYSYQLSEVIFTYLPSKAGSYLVITNRSSNSAEEDYQTLATQILLTLKIIKPGVDQRGNWAQQPGIFEQEEVEEEPAKSSEEHLGGQEEKAEENPPAGGEEEQVVEEIAVAEKGPPAGGEQGEEEEELIIDEAEEDEASNIVSYLIKEHGIEFMYPQVIGAKGEEEGYPVYIFDHGDGSFTVSCWKDQKANDFLFSFVISIGNLGGRTLGDVAAESALAWTNMRGGERVFPRLDKVGQYDAWYLIVENTFFFLWLPARPGEYITISAWDEASFMLAAQIFSTIKIHL